jgi:RecG-like helicase
MAIFARKSKLQATADAERIASDLEAVGGRALGGVIPIADVVWRDHVKVAGRVKAMRVQPWSEQVVSLELTLADQTGGLTIIFLGRRHLGGIHLGSHLVVEGRVTEVRHQLAILNPAYQLLPNKVALPY